MRREQQSYDNYRKFAPLYHFVLAPIALIVILASVVHAIRDAFGFASVLLLGLSLCVALIVALLRQFATKLQDRIIRQEESFRHYVLTGNRLDPRLTLRQIIALRFADDDEFPALCTKAAETGMKPDAIKRSITRWRADHDRV
ncbi:DUF6526 family protein [Paenibacillus flagellatus]|uniref:Uncharacterized protein n=1 Tax=Paenibacillus flagellatus TaxID=2211139 RepID=A0A2V5K593_9BACL|nr:DUF6526 family protein [Paenibacillus flagellatus]PYI53912.1 hypothetical protein DLM86_15270 [Paenibacillus flagellatus]